MYTILIVDDERNERTGIEKLIHRYHYDLNVIQAKNGEEALQIFAKKHIDILLTDIKMPFMSGIELIEAVQKNGWEPVCIVYSAYGEFEYARNAISLGVIQYLLKPVKLEEFQELFEKIFEICREKELRKLEAEKLEEEKKSAENERTGRDLICYLESEKEVVTENMECLLRERKICPVIVSSYSHLFARYWDSYKKEIRECFSKEVFIINREDTQTILLVPETVDSKKRLAGCERLIDVSKMKYQSELFIVMGKKCGTFGELKREYERIRGQLDYQFFLTQSIVLSEDENSARKNRKDMLSVYFEKILTEARLEDFQGMEKEFGVVFDYVEKNMGFSSIYIKYHFSELIKKCCKILEREEYMIDVVEDIYEAKSFQKVKEAAFYLLGKFKKDKREEKVQNYTVSKVKEYIRENYGDCTLSVASLAEKMGISAAYLSTLFKVETDQNLVKYLAGYRMEKAKEMLITTSMKIGEIAEQVGYPNTSYFISLFKTNEGCSPLKYREKMYENR